MLRFRDLGASFSSLGCFVFEIWVLRASVFVSSASFSKLPFVVPVFFFKHQFCGLVWVGATPRVVMNTQIPPRLT